MNSLVNIQGRNNLNHDFCSATLNVFPRESQYPVASGSQQHIAIGVLTPGAHATVPTAVHLNYQPLVWPVKIHLE